MKHSDDSALEAGKRRVLAVDDDEIMRALMAENFAALGHEVVLAEDGEAAAEILARERLDLAVIDISMPKVDGFELLGRIRGGSRTASLPVIVATSLGDDHSIEKAYELGASSFVTKPINWAQFKHHAQFVMRNGQIERDLRLAQAEAAAAAQLKNGLFSVLGHELKTPLAALVGLTDVLAKSLGTRLQDLDAEHLGHVTDAAQRLNLIVSDVLTLSRALAGPRRLGLAEVTAEELLDDSLLGFKSRASQLGITIKAHGSERLRLVCDAHLVRQALRKLIDNALKFSPPGGVVELWAEADGGSQVTFSVRDGGPGLSEARLRDCMLPFMQADMTYARPAEGLGLGLPIANAIAKVHGGSLSVSTTPGHGLTAKLTLPRLVEQAARSA